MVISNLNIKLIEDRLGFIIKAIGIVLSTSIMKPDKELFSILKNNFSDIENFVKEIKAFIEKYRQQIGY